MALRSLGLISFNTTRDTSCIGLWTDNFFSFPTVKCSTYPLFFVSQFCLQKPLHFKRSFWCGKHSTADFPGCKVPITAIQVLGVVNFGQIVTSENSSLLSFHEIVKTISPAPSKRYRLWANFSEPHVDRDRGRWMRCLTKNSVSRAFREIAECFPDYFLKNYRHFSEKKYSNLCALCDSPARCSYSEGFQGSHKEALACLTEKGDVTYVALQSVKEYFGVSWTGCYLLK